MEEFFEGCEKRPKGWSKTLLCCWRGEYLIGGSFEWTRTRRRRLLVDRKAGTELTQTCFFYRCACILSWSPIVRIYLPGGAATTEGRRLPHTKPGGEIIAVGLRTGTKGVHRYFVFTQRSPIEQCLGSFPCVHYHTRRRGARSTLKFKEKAMMGRLETGQRGRQGQVQDEGDESIPNGRMKNTSGDPETDLGGSENCQLQCATKRLHT